MNRLSLFRPERLISFRDINNIQRRFDRLLDEMFSPTTRAIEPLVEFTPPCDIEEADSHYVVSLDVPGMAREDLCVEVQGDNLVISGSRKEEHVSKRGVPQISERYQGRFYRSMSFPGLSEDSKIEAVYRDGVLRVAVPKAPEAKKKSIPISGEKTGIFSKLLGRAEEKKSEKAA